MNIAIVNETFGLGGLERVTSVVGQGLAKQNNVYFYAMRGSQNYYGIEKNFIDGQSFIFKNNILRKLWKSRRIVEQVANHGEYDPVKYDKSNINKLISFSKKNNIDCLIVSGQYLTTYTPYLKENLSNCKIVVWQHNNADIYINEYAKKYRTAYLHALSKADKVICLTHSDLKKYSKYNKNTVCMYNPLTIENTQISNLTSKIISFTGRIAYDHKGIDYLLEIAKKLPKGWQIHIAGSSKEVERLTQDIKKFNLEEKVIFKGPLKGEELINHYLNSSIYMMTSRWEGFGLVLAEAMSFGLPIIAFEQSGSNEVLSDGNYGILVENGNVEEYSSQLHQLLSDYELREKYQQLSLTRVEDFSLDKIIKEWSLILDEVVSPSR